MQDLEHKSIPSGGVHPTDEEGVVEALVSVTGIEDNVGDIIHPGAYAKTLEKRTPKGVWSHDWNMPVSRVKSIEELLPGDRRLPKTLSDGSAWPAEAGALYVKAEFNLKTDAGRNAYENVKFFGDTCEWSIGYKVTKGQSNRDSKGVRHIKSLDLFEYSPVLFGAASNARTFTSDAVASIKSMFSSDEEFKEAMAEALENKTEEKLDTESGDIVEVVEDADIIDKKCDEEIVATVDEETGVVTDLEEEKADEEKSEDEPTDDELIALIAEEEKSEERSEAKTFNLTATTIERLQAVQAEIKALLDEVLVVDIEADEKKEIAAELETKSVADALNDLAAGTFDEKSVDDIAGKVERFSSATEGKDGEEVKSSGIAILDLIDSSIGDANADEERQLKTLAKSIGDAVSTFDSSPVEEKTEEPETKDAVTLSEEDFKALFAS